MASAARSLAPAVAPRQLATDPAIGGNVVRLKPATLPRSTLRRLPERPRRIGFAPFRLVVASDGTFHIFGHGGRHAVLSAFAEECRTEYRDIAVGLRTIRLLLTFVNTCVATLPNAMELMFRDVQSARAAYRHYVKRREWTIEKGKGPRGGLWIHTGDDARSYENALTVLALSRLYRFLAERGEFVDIDPMRMDADKSRLEPGRTRVGVKDENGRITQDTDLLFRTPQAERISPRTNDPFFLDRILEAGDEAGWPLVVRALVEAKGRSGGRDFQLRPMPLYNWLVLGKGDFIHSPGKGSKGKIVNRWRVSSRLRVTLVQLMDETYPEHGGYAGLCRMARSPKGREVLRTLWIFTLDKLQPVSFSYVNDGWFRPIIERMGMRADLGDGNGDPVQRWVTMHWLRHEFTNDLLRRIDESGVSRKDKLVQQILLAKYMGWKSAQAMLEYYGRWFFNKEVDVFIAAQMEASNDNSLPAAFDDDFDADAVTEEEYEGVRQVMGGLLKRVALR
ncbi:MAG: hypothetical protein V4459_08490 [Pseudomonadota bacterium]